MANLIAFPEHDSLLESWSARNFRKQKVVCFDRHLDVKRVSSQNITRLQAASCHPAEIRALRRDPAFSDDASFAYGFDNFAFAASVLGYIRHFVWIVPEGAPLTVPGLARILWEQMSLIPTCSHAIASTFALDSHSVRCNIEELIVEVTTLSRLHHLSSMEAAHVDLDLDYFCDPSGVFDHDVEGVVNGLRRAGLTDHVETLSYSELSGFLPAEAHGLGHHLAEALGLTLGIMEDTRKSAQRSMAALSAGKSISRADLECFWKTELSDMGGAGFALRAVLAANMDDIDTAADAFARAREAGDQARWSAYAIGLRLLKRAQYAEASSWFEEVSKPELVDSVQSHAAILHLLCLCRMGRYEEAVVKAQSCITCLPMRAEGYSLGAWAARRLDKRQAAEGFREQESELRSRWFSLSAH